ncbi:hypothetical protein FQR65_LT16007 [Abscondita terminalis]|nr:hypothetical protein FQR65_LT16007 [Abscondita terminalis]
MNPPSTTPQDALNRIGVTASEENVAEFNIASKTPVGIISYATNKEYIITGISPSDFIKKHGSTQFDLNTLAAQFAMICTDFPNDLALNGKSMAVEFCSKVIYEIGPGSRQVRKQDGDKVWKLIFPYKDADRVKLRIAYICTFKNDQNVETGITNNNTIILTIKQASLLSLMVLQKINIISCSLSDPIVLLTPLAADYYKCNNVVIQYIDDYENIPEEDGAVAGSSTNMNNSNTSTSSSTTIPRSTPMKKKRTDSRNSKVGEVLYYVKIWLKDNEARDKEEKQLLEKFLDRQEKMLATFSKTLLEGLQATLLHQKNRKEPDMD